MNNTARKAIESGNGVGMDMNMKPNDAGVKHGHETGLIVMGFIAAVLYWVSEAAIHAYVLGLGSFIDELIRPKAHEGWMRFSVMGPLVGLGFYASSKVTALRRSEEIIIAERNKAQTYFDTASVILVAIGADGKVIDINRTGCEILGCERAGIIGIDWFENFLHEREKEDVLTVFHELLSGNAKSVEYHENHVLTKGQGERIIVWHNAPLTDGKGAIYGTLSAGMDITERKKTEEELKRSLDETERMNRLMIGRELKIVELKKEMVSLRAKIKELEGASLNR